MADGQTWRTAISDVTADDIFIRGYSIQELMQRLTFTEVTYLTIRGALPRPSERDMLDAILIALVDHQFVSSHVTAARFIVSGNPSVVAGLAGGVLTAGPYTLSPESAALFIDAAVARKQTLGSVADTARVVVAEMAERGERIPGFGHVTHKVQDPRTVTLRKRAAELGCAGERVELYEAIHAEFVRRKGRALPINADGMIAAILGDMGWCAAEMAGIAVVAAMPGLLAHVVEEIQQRVPHRFLPTEAITYTGPIGRQLP
ncbi:MAG: citryl-CoA lyase [Candidatus Rokubacteria bacterium]|nr:citryl-CoA lyase [Candidatus Rokubacteria bacterium]